MPNPPRSCDRLDDGHMTAEVHRRWGGGSSYPWSRFMADCTILISMASLTFLFNQLSSLASTLTLSLVIVWCSCAQCSPTAVSGFLRLRWSFILVASILPVSPMYVRGHSGHSTWYTSPHFWASGVLSLGCTRIDRMVLMGRLDIDLIN